MRRIGLAASCLVTCVGCIYSDWSLVDRAPDAAVGPSADGGADASTECSAILCESFDGKSIGSGLDIQKNEGNTVEIARIPDAPSPNGVLHATRGPAGAAYVTKVIPHPKALARATVSGTIRLVRHDPVGTACVLGMSFNDNSGDPERTVRILLGPGKSSVQEKTGGTPDRVLASHAFTAPSVERFHRFELSVTVGGHVQLRIDGAATLAVDEALDPSWTPTTNTRVVAGINFADANTTNWDVHVDDLRFDGS